MEFVSRLLNASRRNRSLLCVGLDPDPSKMPVRDVFEFNKAIIDATSDLVCCYKPNLAFYEAEGARGWDILKQTVECIPKGIPVIADAKRGDIGNTAKAYARAIFDELSFDAVTVNPYLGFDAIESFLNYKDKGVFILCRTSNPGAMDFQNFADASGRHLYETVAQKASEWNVHGNIGLVVGATYPEELRLIRQNHPDMPILIPGVGAQGGDLATVLRYGVNSEGEKAIINSSRQIIYASRGKDFARAARHAALELRDTINHLLSNPT